MTKLVSLHSLHLYSGFLRDKVVGVDRTLENQPVQIKLQYIRHDKLKEGVTMMPTLANSTPAKQLTYNLDAMQGNY